jgi:hypothetical protein
VSGQLHVPAALPPGKSSRYPFYRRLGGPQSRSGWYGEVKIFYPTGTRTPASLVVQPVASRYTAWAIPMTQSLLRVYKGQTLPTSTAVFLIIFRSFADSWCCFGRRNLNKYRVCNYVYALIQGSSLRPYRKSFGRLSGEHPRYFLHIIWHEFGLEA